MSHNLLSEVNEEQWAEWRTHPVTQVFLHLLAKRREALKENWARGDFTDQGQFGTALKNAAAIGACDMLREVLELDINQVNGELKDDE